MRVADTTRASMANDGKRVVHQALDIAPDCSASYRIRPQDQLFGSPRPRKARPAAESTAREAVSTTETTMTGATAGRRCLRMIQTCEPPVSRAASMYGSRTTDNAWDRTTLVTSGQEKNAMTSTRVTRLGPASAATRIISGSTGSDRQRSTTVPITVSAFGK